MALPKARFLKQGISFVSNNFCEPESKGFPLISIKYATLSFRKNKSRESTILLLLLPGNDDRFFHLFLCSVLVFFPLRFFLLLNFLLRCSFCLADRFYFLLHFFCFHWCNSCDFSCCTFPVASRLTSGLSANSVRSYISVFLFNGDFVGSFLLRSRKKF